MIARIYIIMATIYILFWATSPLFSKSSNLFSLVSYVHIKGHKWVPSSSRTLQGTWDIKIILWKGSEICIISETEEIRKNHLTILEGCTDVEGISSTKKVSMFRNLILAARNLNVLSLRTHLVPAHFYSLNSRDLTAHLRSIAFLFSTQWHGSVHEDERNVKFYFICSWKFSTWRRTFHSLTCHAANSVLLEPNYIFHTIHGRRKPRVLIVWTAFRLKRIDTNDVMSQCIKQI